MSPAFFEGPEKKVELTVVDGFPSLRSLGDHRWNAVVEAADARVLSKRSTDLFDAYLLSESSLFVYDTFVTMITCGRTRLVDAVDQMLKDISIDAVALLIYERKNEHFPHQQATSFYEDAVRLRDRFPGAALRFGVEHEHSVRIFHTTMPFVPEPTDTTIEVLMHGIDEGRAATFRGVESPSVGTTASRLGLDRILDGFDIDEYAFEPAGYSLNALRRDIYYTVHVTPERIGSYASFETNFDFRSDATGLVSRVVDLFQPESFDVVVFVPDDAPINVEVPGYALRRHVQEPVSGYHVTFQHFFKPVTAPRRAFPIPLGI